MAADRRAEDLGLGSLTDCLLRAALTFEMTVT